MNNWKRRGGTHDPDVPPLPGHSTLRERATKAATARLPYLEEDGEQATVDLLTDLMHLADMEGESFEEMVLTAKRNYQSEANGEF